MKARAVIGANYGDEGKGLVTDYLASRGGDVVVRFNGGAQAGHTVVTPDGRRHVFSHFGSGTFHGTPTYLSQFFIVNPVLFIKELADLQKHVTGPKVYVHPDAIVTTPFDMDMNQYRERKRGNNRHGSCGVGIFETITRHKKFSLTMKDLWYFFDHPSVLKVMISNIRQHYGMTHTDETDAMAERFVKDCEWFANYVKPATMVSFTDPIFEGAQGLMIGQENMADFPHLSPSYCGMRNVRELAWEGGFRVTDVYYVSRTYLTRHGAGPLPGEYKKWYFRDKTNVNNPWQGQVRYAPLDLSSLRRRIHADCNKPKVFMTHCDTMLPPVSFEMPSLYSYGETRNDIEVKQKRRAA